MSGVLRGINAAVAPPLSVMASAANISI